MLSCLPFVNPCGKQIDYIDHRHAKLESVPDDVIKNFKTLEECHLDANQIKDLPNSFFRLERIKLLTLSDNELTTIPSSLDLIELPKKMSSCNLLQELDISNNGIKRLPDDFTKLKQLRTLCMNAIDMDHLPTDFGMLSTLEKFELRDNVFQELPDSFSRLERLEFLDLGGNEFSKFEIGNLTNLQQLDLSNNEIQAVPETISGLTSLCDLNLSQNFIQCLPNSIGQLEHLAVLRLNQNHLVTLTPSIGDCSKLQELFLTNNMLSALPKTIGQLRSMYHMNSDQNKIFEIPSTIGDCEALNIFSMRENLLRRLPDQIGQCSKLRVLDVSENLIDRLPLSLASCPLTALWLSRSQSQPIVSLQVDFDEETKEEFLTCYLLPQSSLKPEQDRHETDFNTLANSPQAEYHTSFPAYDSGGFGIKTEANQAYDQFIGGGDQAENSSEKEANESSIVMTKPTPLASPTARDSNKLIPTDLPHDVLKSLGFNVSSVGQRPGDDSQASSRVHFSNDVSDRSGSRDHIMRFPKTRYPKAARRSSDVTSEGIDDVPSSIHHNGGDYQLSPTLSPDKTTSTTDDERDRRPGSRTTTTNDNSYSSAKPSTISSIDRHSEPHYRSDVTSSSSGHKSSPKQPEPRLIAGQPPRYPTAGDSERRPSSQLSSKANEADDEAAYSSGGEEISTLSRRVGFTDDVEDNEEKARLIRRDTPHYTKRARLHPKPASLVDDSSDPVKRLMEKYKPYNATTTSNQSAARMDTYPQPTALRLANDSPHRQAKSHRVTISIRRPPGAGLGLSIAGGVGSIPFRHNDQGIFVSRLTPNSCVAQSGLQLYDKLLEVNGVNLVGAEHQLAVDALRAKRDDFRVVVERLLPLTHSIADNSECLQESNDSSLSNSHSEIFYAPLVLTVKTARSSFTLAPKLIMSSVSQGMKEVFVVDRVDPGSQLQVGDRVLKINGTDVTKSQRHIRFSGSSSLIELEVLRTPSPAIASSLIRTPSPVVAPSPQNLQPNSFPNANRPTTLVRTGKVPSVERITLHLDGGPLGLAICGGSDNFCQPFGAPDNEPGIFISKISSEGAANHNGLNVGDRILSVNGVDLRHATHDEAVELLIKSTKQLCLEIRHDRPPPGLKRISIVCRSGEPWGLKVTGGSITTDDQSSPQSPEDPLDSVHVSSISPDGPFGRDGRLKVGDQLLELNGCWLNGICMNEVVAMFHETDTIELLACSGSDSILSGHSNPGSPNGFNCDVDTPTSPLFSPHELPTDLNKLIQYRDKSNVKKQHQALLNDTRSLSDEASSPVLATPATSSNASPDPRGVTNRLLNSLLPHNWLARLPPLGLPKMR